MNVNIVKSDPGSRYRTVYMCSAMFLILEKDIN